MASALYTPYKQALMDQVNLPDLDTDTIRSIFLDTNYTFSGAHAHFGQLTNTHGDAGTGRANGEALASKSVTNGIFDATDTVFASVTATNINAIALYKDSGTDTTSWLICYIDGFSSISPSGAQVTIQWDSGASKIFAF